MCLSPMTANVTYCDWHASAFQKSLIYRRVHYGNSRSWSVKDRWSYVMVPALAELWTDDAVALPPAVTARNAEL